MSSRRRDDDRDHATSRTLKVAEAGSRDVGRRIGRVDPKVANEIGISTGDAIEISAGKNKKTTVLNWPAYQEDFGRGLIRIDGYTRSKLEVGTMILSILEESKQKRLNKLHLLLPSLCV
jgi:hypothetical protein